MVLLPFVPIAFEVEVEVDLAVPFCCGWEYD